MIKATFVNEDGVELFKDIDLPTIPRVGEHFGLYAKGSGFSTPILKVEHKFVPESVVTANARYNIPKFERVIITINLQK